MHTQTDRHCCRGHNTRGIYAIGCPRQHHWVTLHYLQPAAACFSSRHTAPERWTAASTAPTIAPTTPAASFLPLAVVLPPTPPAQRLSAWWQAPGRKGRAGRLVAGPGEEGAGGAPGGRP
jgi:hypothetical protein